MSNPSAMHERNNAMNRMMKIIAGGFVLSAAITAHAGENLIKNGTFEGTGSQST